MIAIILSKLGLFVGSAFKAWTNKTGRCPSSAFLKIVSAIFVRLKMSLATLWPLNPPTISGAICGNSLGRSGLWLVPENLCFSSTNQKPERWRPFGTGVVRHCPQGLFSPFYTFLPATFFRPFRLSLVPTICPWVSEDDYAVEKKLKKIRLDRESNPYLCDYRSVLSNQVNQVNWRAGQLWA